MRRGGQDYFYHADALGNVTALTDATGNTVETVEYQAFGRAVIKDGQGGLHDQSTVGNELLYASREWDPETNLYYLRARHYDPDTGRFLQEDLVSSINQYAYADNNPILLTDPLGLKPWAGVNFIGGFASGILWGYEGIGRSYYEQCSKAYQYGQMAGMAWWFALGPASAIDAAVARAAAARAATQGIYEFTSATGETYVGQSGNIAARIKQHLKSGRLLAEDLHTVKTTPISGDKMAREVTEQLRIIEHGGLKNLVNVRNPIGPERAHLLPQSARDFLGY